MALSSLKEKKILLVGLLCLDIVNECVRYPNEDDDVRALSSDKFKGGNASNSAGVLAQFRALKKPILPEVIKPYLMASIADDSESRYLLTLIESMGIDHKYCVLQPNARTPTSYITRSAENGSRTIVHFAKLPELSAEDLLPVPLNSFDWIHIEARTFERLMDFVEYIDKFPQRSFRISLEIEKPKEKMEDLIPFADYVMFSKDFVKSKGFHDASTWLRHIRSILKESAYGVCAWGSEGAYGITPRGDVVFAPAFHPPSVKDTLGAGDTFNAALIYSLLVAPENLESALSFACKVAGVKCGIVGLDQIIESYNATF